MRKYTEPSWNFPVTRFFKADGTEIIKRKDKTWNAGQLIPRMISVLKKEGRTSAILSIAQASLVSTKVIAFSQHCFWTGELVIGGLEGVVRTEAGWLEGREVTLVHYDPKKTSSQKIEKYAKAKSCADRSYQGDVLKGYKAARKSDQKRQIQGTRFAQLKGLTPYQLTKINALARSSPQKALRYLTPKQKAQL